MTKRTHHEPRWKYTYVIACSQLWSFKLKVCIKVSRCNRSASHFINERSSFSNMISPARKRKNKYYKKSDPYQPTMNDWIEMYQKFKYAKEVNSPDLKPSYFLRYDKSGTRFSCKQLTQNIFSREYPKSLNGELRKKNLPGKEEQSFQKLKRASLSMYKPEQVSTIWISTVSLFQCFGQWGKKW